MYILYIYVCGYVMLSHPLNIFFRFVLLTEARVVPTLRGLPVELPALVRLQTVLRRLLQQPSLELRRRPMAQLRHQRAVVAAHEDDPEAWRWNPLEALPLPQEKAHKSLENPLREASSSIYQIYYTIYYMLTYLLQDLLSLSQALAAGDLVEHRPYRGPGGREDLRGVQQQAAPEALGVMRQQPRSQQRGARVAVHQPGVASQI